MKTRRQFIGKTLWTLGGLMLCWAGGIRRVLAKASQILLPKDTKMESLIQKNPADLDTRNLNVVPLEEFETMGLTDHSVDLAKWTLEIQGLVETPIRLGYMELIELPAIEREVLLICPGFFANHGKWRGFSLGALLRQARISASARNVVVQGPEGPYMKTASFPLERVLEDGVFLAHHVNGVPLPQKHGFPLRVVAEGFYGYDWVKYATFVRVE